MKRLTLTSTAILVFVSILYCTNGFAQEFFETGDTFFRTYVNEKGMVNYSRLKKMPNDLLTLDQLIENADLENWPDEQKKAFLINAYNIVVIKQVIDQYPVKSPMDVKGFFDEIYHNVGGKKVSLNELEKGMLFKQFPDARLHFVLVCAAMDCPKLANFAYLPANLDQQIEDRTKYILNDEDFIRGKESGVEVSMIFNWYKNDFGASNKAILEYINSYRDSDFVIKSGISFYEYDWTLNTQ